MERKALVLFSGGQDPSRAVAVSAVNARLAAAHAQATKKASAKP